MATRRGPGVPLWLVPGGPASFATMLSRVVGPSPFRLRWLHQTALDSSITAATLRHNQKLWGKKMSVHKITPSNPRIASLLSDVTKGNIKIPVFQRDYVWEDEQIMSLLDSIYRGYPVGSILLWSTKERLNHERNVGGFRLPETPEDYPVLYVLDGQQRLTTLYGVFHSDSDTDDRELAGRFSVCFSPAKEEFVHASVAPPDASINLRNILDTTRLLPELQRFSPADQAKIASLTERFKDYEFPVVTIKDRSNQEVCRVFQRINSSGTSLSTLELLAAWTWSDQFDLRNEIEALLERLADKGYEELGETQIMRCLASIVTDDIETDSLVDVEPDKLISGMSTLKQAMAAAIDFLESEIKIKNIVFVPFPIMLVPLVRFFADNLKPNADQRRGLCRWFWHCAFTQRYKAGTNTFVMEDLKHMQDLARGDNVFQTLKASIDPAIFKKTWRINSTVAKAAICLLAQYDPRSFFSGAPVNLGTTLAAYNAREFHHIYPKAYLAAHGIPFHESNVIANVCMLTSHDNNTISDKDPRDYFSEILADIRDSVFEKALIPPGFRDGSKPYAEFIAKRAKLLATKAEELIETGWPRSS